MPRKHRNISKADQLKLREDALALAELIYDMYKEDQASANIDSGQNNAQKPSNS